MKRSLRFLALVAAVGVTCWLTANSGIQAASDCESMDGSHCTTPGAYADCYWRLAQEQIVCQCDGTSHTWVCYF